jgi:hypothetical protein
MALAIGRPAASTAEKPTEPPIVHAVAETFLMRISPKSFPVP